MLTRSVGKLEIMSNKKHDKATERLQTDAEFVESQIDSWSQDFNTDDQGDAFLRDWAINIRPDTKATIFVMDQTNYHVIPPIRNFFLTAMNFSHQERAQVMETFDALDVTMLGRKAVLVTLTFEMYNTDNKNWRDQWMYLWDKYLRGSKAAAAKNRIVITADNLILEGVMLEYSFQEQGMKQNSIGISVNMICPADKIGPIKLLKTVTMGPSNTDNIRKIYLKTLEAGEKSSYFANGRDS